MSYEAWHRVELSAELSYQWWEIKKWLKTNHISSRTKHHEYTIWFEHERDVTLFRLHFGI